MINPTHAEDLSGQVTVCVLHHPRGRWEVLAPGTRGRIPCETLEDARRLAYQSVAHFRHCELVVRDAYNRVVERELIEGHQLGATGSRRPRPETQRQPGR